MPFIEQLGQQVAGQAVGAGMGLLLQGINDRRQIKQQQKLQDMQIKGQKEMGEFQYGQQMKLWNDTNYSAQIAQMKKAGLNPALMYGMGGGGGATTAAGGGSVSGGSAPVGGGEIPAMLGMGLNLAMQKAQIDNIQADTEKKKAEVPATNAQTELTKTNTMIAELQRKLADRTFDYNVNSAYEQSVNIGQQNRLLSSQADVAEGTQKIQIEKAQQELLEIGVRIALATAQKTYTEEQTQAVINQVKNDNERLKNEQNQVKIQQQLATWETSWGKQVAGLLGNIIGIIPGLKKLPTPIKEGAKITNTREIHVHKKQ